ncbi:ATP-dependent 6-phosphofructokinase [Thermoflexales bacterium]|nr:ATP-dependent 6-phosphofructokinase [Thermoflexales bacterium]
MTKKCIAVLTSGGDAPGMNAAARAVVRTALERGIRVFAVYEGYQGLIEGDTYIREMNWDSVGGILGLGGTIIGTARSDGFRTREGRRIAARNLVEREVDSLVVVGGDGSLTGANLFRQEWPSLLTDLVELGEITAEAAAQRANLFIVGLVGSIDNDMHGTSMTIGADTALHRITEAIDAIASTAASHQRTFVVKVMGRNCGYLALMAALATGAEWVLIPENPPEWDNWEEKMVADLRRGRQAGRRDSIVVIAEGARDKHGNPIGSSYIQKFLEEELREEVRVTVLGHVQRGGAPSAFDRNLGTMMGYEAVQTVLAAQPEDESQMIALRGNRITTAPLMKCVEQTRAIAAAIDAHDYERAMTLRGDSFRETFRTLRTLLRSLPHAPTPGQKHLRLAVMNCGAPAPGMNTAVRAAVRLGLDRGHTILGIANGFKGLIDGEVQEMDWMSVNGWAATGGSNLGTSREVPSGRDFYAIARTLEKYGIQGILMVGGLSGYQGAYQLFRERENYPAFNIPIICLPASINNNLPGSDLSVGADTALNVIVEAVDKIKQAAVAQRRCYLVEVMGRKCGYLALMSGLATGAERVYLHEEGICLSDLVNDVEQLRLGFEHGKRLGLMIRNEEAHQVYSTNVLCAIFEAESSDLFEVRQSILGHIQQGGNPSPFDRIQATRFAARCIDFLIEQAQLAEPAGSFMGLEAGGLNLHSLEELPKLVDKENQRPKRQWWMDVRTIAKLMSQPMPSWQIEQGK